MFRRSSHTAPSVGEATGGLASALRDLVGAAGRWVAAQPNAQQVPVYAQQVRQASTKKLLDASAWAGATASKARQRGAKAAKATKTRTTNLLLVAGLLWWVDRLVGRDAEGR